jgi:hypothetical protein
MTAALRRVMPVLAALMLMIVAVGFVGRSCARLRLRGRSFAMSHAPAHLPRDAERGGAR